MENVIQYRTNGEFVKVVLKDGNTYSDVIVCPDPFDPYSKRHILEKYNGDTIFVETSNIEGILYM